MKIKEMIKIREYFDVEKEAEDRINDMFDKEEWDYVKGYKDFSVTLDKWVYIVEGHKNTKFISE